MAQSENKNPYVGTQTEKNLQAAIAGESTARNNYTFFASKAKKEGFEQIAAILFRYAEYKGYDTTLTGNVDRNVCRICQDG